jgi:hypothetical protein
MYAPPPLRRLPTFHMAMVKMDKAFTSLDQAMAGGIVKHAKQSGITIPPS